MRRNLFVRKKTSYASSRDATVGRKEDNGIERVECTADVVDGETVFEATNADSVRCSNHVGIVKVDECGGSIVRPAWNYQSLRDCWDSCH